MSQNESDVPLELQNVIWQEKLHYAWNTYLLDVSKKYENSAGLSSGKKVGLKLAKSVSNIQFHAVIITFSIFISPWQTPEM